MTDLSHYMYKELLTRGIKILLMYDEPVPGPRVNLGDHIHETEVGNWSENQYI